MNEVTSVMIYRKDMKELLLAQSQYTIKKGKRMNHPETISQAIKILLHLQKCNECKSILEHGENYEI